MNSGRAIPAVVFGLAALAAGVAAGVSAQSVTYFRIPTANSYPGGIATGPDGALWFNAIGTNRIGRVTADGAITEFVAPAHSGPFSYNYPGGIAAGPDGALWFAEDLKICRITDAGVVTEFPIPGGSTSLEIAHGSDGALWFTEIDGPDANDIGRITTSGVITQFTVPTGYIGGIASGPDGALWFTDFYNDKIGRITTSGIVTEFPVATANSQPDGIVAGPDGALWFAEESRLGRITTAGVVTEFSVRPVSPLSRVVSGPDGALWFTDFYGNRIGRFALGAGTCAPDTTTLCLSDGRFQVRTEWTTSDGSTGFGQAVGLTADTGYFTFFEPGNVEVVAKVLNGCGINSRYWVFAGGLTNVHVTMTVVDLETGATKTYDNPLGTPFQPIQDAGTFAGCR